MKNRTVRNPRSALNKQVLKFNTLKLQSTPNCSHTAQSTVVGPRSVKRADVDWKIHHFNCSHVFQSDAGLTKLCGQFFGCDFLLEYLVSSQKITLFDGFFQSHYALKLI